jgi:hypothetical protein
VDIWDKPESAVVGAGRKVLQALADAPKGPKEEVAHVASSRLVLPEPSSEAGGG